MVRLEFAWSEYTYSDLEERSSMSGVRKRNCIVGGYFSQTLTRNL